MLRQRREVDNGVAIEKYMLLVFLEEELAEGSDYFLNFFHERWLLLCCSLSAVTLSQLKNYVSNTNF